MAQNPQVIELLTDSCCKMVHSEALADTGSAIQPGMLVEETATGVQEHSTADANAQKLFALTDLMVGGDIDNVYAVGQTVRYGAAHAGCEVYAWVAASAAAITKGAALSSAGDGTVKNVAASAATTQAQRDGIVCYALEAVDNSGGGSAVRIKVRVA